MTPGAAAQSSLARWERGLPSEGGLPFEPLLRRCRLDYSPASLGRIDIFLDAVRSARRPQEADFLADAAQRQLLYLLAFYAGEVIGRAVERAPQWLLPAQAAALAPQPPLPAHPFHAALSARFGDARNADGALLFLPLAALCGRLFGPSGAVPQGLQAAAAAWWPEALRDAERAKAPLPPRAGEPWPPEMPAPSQPSEDSPEALCIRAQRLMRGEAAAPDLGAALDLYRRAAEAGLLEAQLQAARLHLRHDGPAPDLLEAERWLRLAAAQGSDKARELIAQLELDQPPTPTLGERVDAWTDRTVDWVVDRIERLAAARSASRRRPQ